MNIKLSHIMRVAVFEYKLDVGACQRASFARICWQLKKVKIGNIQSIICMYWFDNIKNGNWQYFIINYCQFFHNIILFSNNLLR